MEANTLHKTLQLALRERGEGRPEVAEQHLHEALKAQPGQPDLLRLLGLCAHDRRDFDTAEQWFSQSLKSEARQPQVWRELGELQEDMGRWPEAEACYRNAVELKSDFMEAHYNRARALHQLGQQQMALAALAEALRQRPPSQELLAQCLQLRAMIEQEQGRLDAALKTLIQAIEVEPRRGALHHNAGAVLQAQGRHAEALAAHEEARRLGIDAADAHYNRANSLQSLGRHEEALAGYRAALQREPLHGLALYDVARLRWRMGHEDFCAELEAAAAQFAQPLPLGIQGRLLLQAGRHEQAASAFKAALARGEAAGYHDGLGQAAIRLGRPAESLTAHRRAIELAPDDASARANFASSLLQAGEATLAAVQAERAVRLNPLDQQAWALLGTAWRASGNERNASWLNDYARHVQVFDLEPPEGFADMASFNAALAAELDALHVDARAPVDQTLRHGSQTQGNVFDLDRPLLQALKQRIAEAVDRYVAGLRALPPDSSHPLLARVGHGWRFSDSWSSRLDRSGYHTNHLHPHGWISSCYYVALPQAVADEQQQPGWIRFGQPDFESERFELGPQRVEQPRVGRLVLFPSFMWHGTVPFDEDVARLTVAFDVVPSA